MASPSSPCSCSISGSPGRPAVSGVDAFFVLSGFLITGLLIREHERTGRISLPAFYARRVRRILPAALVTIAVTIGVAAVVLAPLDLPEVTLDGAAAALSIGNIRFAIGATDYFGPTMPSPFRHFWSLGVEEQFYLLWPALMILAPARGGSRRRVALVIGGVVAASLAGSIWLTDVDQAWAFYSFPTRAWQLGLGGLLAVTAGWLARRSSLLLGPIALAGVVGLVGAVVLVDGSMPCPGTVALLPAVATAAVVAGGDRRGPRRDRDRGRDGELAMDRGAVPARLVAQRVAAADRPGRRGSDGAHRDRCRRRWRRRRRATRCDGLGDGLRVGRSGAPPGARRGSDGPGRRTRCDRGDRAAYVRPSVIELARIARVDRGAHQLAGRVAARGGRATNRGAHSRTCCDARRPRSSARQARPAAPARRRRAPAHEGPERQGDDRQRQVQPGDRREPAAGLLLRAEGRGAHGCPGASRRRRPR